LNEILFEPKERNFEKRFNKQDVLSVSGLYGIVNQIEFQGRSFAGASVDNYHIVELNDIVYTKSPLKSNPYGIIKSNKHKAGIVSTLYAVYRPKENLNSSYLDYYFQLDDNTNRYLRPLVHKGAKNDMKINNFHVLSDYITIPQKEEQNKIATFLTSISNSHLKN
jgi:type I restriction enzyme S subunit